MHVPEPGDHIFAVGIYDLILPPLVDEANFRHSTYPSSFDHDSHTRFNPTIARAHYVDVGEDKCLSPAFRLGLGTKEGGQTKANEEGYLHTSSSVRSAMRKG